MNEGSAGKIINNVHAKMYLIHPHATKEQSVYVVWLCIHILKTSV